MPRIQVIQRGSVCMAAVHGTKAEASLVMVKLADKDYERFKSISWDTYICMNYWHIKEVPLYGT